VRLAIRIGGAGGQGIVLAGLILAEAAVLAGRRVAATQAYGPESRGGASRSDVVISDQPVAFPVARRLDVLVALTQEACVRSLDALAPEGFAILDSGRVAPPGDCAAACYLVPISETARAASGSARAANVVALGAVRAMTGVVPYQTLRDAVARRVPAASLAANLAALEAGERLGEEIRAAPSKGERSGGPHHPAPAGARLRE
jgi:2-oxoglutarate ferredoxin oxidoreductase subunit gamma